MNIPDYLIPVIRAALEAGAAALEIYGQDFEVEQKTDQSPLTLADRRSHEIIVDHLSSLQVPILSEEGKDIEYEQRSAWPLLWIVDPLDGTKEFVKKNGEFTVNIALVKEKRPVLGVIFVPVLDRLYFAAERLGSFRMDRTRMPAGWENDQELLVSVSDRLPMETDKNRPYTIVGSRSHATPELEAFVEQKRRHHDRVDFISAGSSLKFCQVAEGFAEIYPRLGPTMEWDTAAGQVIAEQSGATVLVYETGRPLEYNKENLKNPWFVVENPSRA